MITRDQVIEILRAAAQKDFAFFDENYSTRPADGFSHVIYDGSIDPDFVAAEIGKLLNPTTLVIPELSDEAFERVQTAARECSAHPVSRHMIENIVDAARLEVPPICETRSAAEDSSLDQTDSPDVHIAPLEWEDCGEEMGHCSDNLLGRYWVELVHSAYQVRFVTLRYEREHEEKITSGLGLEAAKGVAQADYERRIRSILGIS